MDLPGGAIDLLQHTDADCRASVPVSAVLALDGPDPADWVDGPYVAGVVAGAAEPLGLAAIPVHQVPYGELERAVIQGVDLGDAQPQGSGAYAFPLGTLSRLLEPKGSRAGGYQGGEDEDPPVREEPLHDGGDQANRHDCSHQQGNLLVLLPGTADRTTPVPAPYRAAAQRTPPDRTGTVAALPPRTCTLICAAMK